MLCRNVNNGKVGSVFLLVAFFVLFGISYVLKSEPNELGWDEEKKYIPFDTSMQAIKYKRFIADTGPALKIDSDDLYGLFKTMYEKNNLSKIKPSEVVKIPKIIHVIWINGEIDDCSVPKELRKYLFTWVKYHPGWEFKLWTDADVAKMKLYNQDLYDDARNFGMKSDILRCEIIYKYGGVYVDVDLECLKPLDLLHHTYDFYIGLQPLDSRFLQVGSGILAAKPGHSILKHVITTMGENYKQNKGAPEQTGPKHFTRAFFNIVGTLDTIDIAFPATYFYPLGAYEKGINRKRWEDLGAYAVHWWGKTWMPPEYRRNEFKKIKNPGLIPDWL